jgi:hypothetical protein
MFDSSGADSDAEGGPGFVFSWRGGEADFKPNRFEKVRPWGLHETPVSGDRDGYETPGPPAQQAEWARKQVPILLACLTPKQRFVLSLYWGIHPGVEDGHPYSTREIAELMGVKQPAVQKLKDRAMSTLVKALAPHLSTEGDPLASSPDSEAIQGDAETDGSPARPNDVERSEARLADLFRRPDRGRSSAGRPRRARLRFDHWMRQRGRWKSLPGNGLAPDRFCWKCGGPLSKGGALAPNGGLRCRTCGCRD